MGFIIKAEDKRIKTESVNLLREAAQNEYCNAHDRTRTKDSKAGIALPIIATYFLALAQMNDYCAINAFPITGFGSALVPATIFTAYTVALGSIDIGFFAVVVYPAPALVADASPLYGFTVAQRANDHIVGTGAGADIHRGDGIYGFHNIHKGFNRRFCRNFGGEGGICIGSFGYGRIGFRFGGIVRCLGFLRGGGGVIRIVSGYCGAFGRTGGFDGAGVGGIFLAGDTASEGGHHADDQEQGQDFLECVVFH